MGRALGERSFSDELGLEEFSLHLVRLVVVGKQIITLGQGPERVLDNVFEELNRLIGQIDPVSESSEFAVSVVSSVSSGPCPTVWRKATVV